MIKIIINEFRNSNLKHFLKSNVKKQKEDYDYSNILPANTGVI